MQLSYGRFLGKSTVLSITLGLGVSVRSPHANAKQFHSCPREHDRGKWLR